MTRAEKKVCSGHSLIELVIAISAATMLLGGLGSTVWVTSAALDEAGSGAVQTVMTGETTDTVMADLKYALRFSERTANSVAFQTPDRDGDEVSETIRYAWSGTPGDPLTIEYNGGAPAVVADDIQQIDLNYLSRTMTGTGFAKGVITTVEFQGFTEDKHSQFDADVGSLRMSTPNGTMDGDLLIAAVATDGDTRASLSAPAGWNLIAIEHRYYQVTFAVWWKIASSEPFSHQFYWMNPSEQGYGWMMRFTGNDPVNPIDAWALTTTGSGDTLSPPSPEVTTTVADTLILRLGGFDDDDIVEDVPGLPDHIAITMDKSNIGTGTVSGGAGYDTQSTVGPSGTSSFSTTDMEQSVTVTIAIAPAGI